MEEIKNKRILAAVGIVCLLLGCFLPYFSITIFGLNATHSLSEYWEGYLILALTVANALFIFQDIIEKYVPQAFNNGLGALVKKLNNPKFALIPTLLALGLAIYLYSELDVAAEYIKYGIGFWILWIGIIALVGHSIFYKGQAIQSMQQPVQPSVAPVASVETPFSSQQPDQAVTPLQSEPIQQPVQPLQTEESKKFCPQCGTQVNGSSETCFMCGNKF